MEVTLNSSDLLRSKTYSVSEYREMLARIDSELGNTSAMVLDSLAQQWDGNARHARHRAVSGDYRQGVTQRSLERYADFCEDYADELRRLSRDKGHEPLPRF